MRFPEIQKYRQAIGFRGLALKLRHLEFQRIVLAPNLLIFLRRVLQREVLAPSIAKPPEARGACTFKWRDCANRPNTNKPALGLPLDLYGQHQYLQNNDACKQDQ